MISDNFVVGDNVYLNELRNFFFEVLGMMSITHYGAIGDGRYDNYASLQVAIDDANRRKLMYIYVPMGQYRYRGELLRTETVTFIGNPGARIFNDKTGVEIPIEQFGMPNIGVMTPLNASLELIDGEPLWLESGAYYTGDFNVTINSAEAIKSGSPFYWDSETQTLSWGYGTAQYYNNAWNVYEGYGTNYLFLSNKPSINGVALIGNKTSSQLHIGGQATESDILMATLTADHTTYSTGKEKLYIEEAQKIGGNFNISNYKVVVSGDISLVKINIGVAYQSIGQSPGIIVWIYKNDEPIFSETFNEAATFASIPSLLLPVANNDTLALRVSDLVTDSHNTVFGDSTKPLTYITLEAVDYDHPEPAPYVRVHHIISDGNQIIDTGVAPQHEILWKAKFAFTDISLSNQTVFGSKKTGSWLTFGYKDGGSNYKYWNFRWGRSLQYESDIDNVQINNDALRAQNVLSCYEKILHLSTDQSKFGFSANGAAHEGGYGNVYTFSSTANFYLFGSNQDDAYNKARIELEYSQIFVGDTLVRDFVPVKRRSDDAVGLYDLVNDQFYANIGTGAFTYDYETGEEIGG